MLATAAQAERNMFSPCPAFLPRNVRQVFSTLYKKMQVVLYKYRSLVACICIYVFLWLEGYRIRKGTFWYILSYWSFRFFLSFSMFSALLRELLSRWACTSFTLWGQCSGMVNFDVCSTNLSIILTYLNDSKCILHVKLFCDCIHLELVHATFAASPHFHLWRYLFVSLSFDLHDLYLFNLLFSYVFWNSKHSRIIIKFCRMMTDWRKPESSTGEGIGQPVTTFLCSGLQHQGELGDVELFSGHFDPFRSRDWGGRVHWGAI